MRQFAPSFVLFVVALVPNVGNAQADQFPTPPPRVNAATASWQVDGQPVLFQGDLYYPTAGRVFFDANVMIQIGTCEGVPIYADVTRPPFSLVLVPVAGNMMRPYEPHRTGQQAGTEGGPAPFFALASPSAARSPEYPARSVRTVGSVARRAPLFEVPPGKSHSVATIVQSVPGPQSNDGIWILYDGARWRSAGAAVQYVHERFTAVGAYHGFPVYRSNDGRDDEIYIAAVSGGALTPYRPNQ